MSGNDLDYVLSSVQIVTSNQENKTLKNLTEERISFKDLTRKNQEILFKLF